MTLKTRLVDVPRGIRWDAFCTVLAEIQEILFLVSGYIVLAHPLDDESRTRKILVTCLAGNSTDKIIPLRENPFDRVVFIMNF